MAFLEKHYPDVGRARNLLEGRLRELEYRQQEHERSRVQREQIMHRNHHHELESNIVHLYDLVRQTAENQSSMQREMGMIRNKSVGNVSIHQIEHRHRVHHLENAYRKAEERANSLSKRIQHYYPRLEKRGYHSRFDRYPLDDIQNEISLKREQLESDWKTAYQTRVPQETRYDLQEEIELQQLNKEREILNNLIHQEELNSRCIQENIKLKQTYESLTQALPTANFSYDPNLHDNLPQTPSIRHDQPTYLDASNLSRSQSYQNQSRVSNLQRSQTSQVGKIYARDRQSERNRERDVRKQNKSGEIDRTSEIVSKENSVVNQTRIIHDTYDSIDNNNILIDEDYDDERSVSPPMSGNKSIAYLKTKPNNSELSNSLCQSKFRAKTNYKLLEESSESQEESVVVKKDRLDKSSRQKSRSPPLSKSGYTKYSSSKLKHSSAFKRRYEAENHSSIYQSALDRINCRIQASLMIFENSAFKNTKHQQNNLLSRYNLQTKLRREVRDKLSKHHLASKKYGLA